MESPLENVIIVIAQQRSGTSALRKSLAKLDLFVDFGEVFHEKTIDSPASFFGFIKGHPDRIDLYTKPTKSNIEQLFLEYFEYLVRLAVEEKSKYVLVDIKHNSLHHFNLTWQQPSLPPNIFNLLRKYNIKIVGIERKNIFNQALSSVVARSINTWHAGRKKELNIKKITVNPMEINQSMNRIRRNNDVVNKWLDTLENKISLYYEELFDGDLLGSEVIKSLRLLLMEEIPEPIEVPLKKINKSPRKNVSNKQEVISFFKDKPSFVQVYDALVEQD